MGGRGRGGFGRGGGRGGFGGGALPPMGLTFADIQAMSREGTALYPPMVTPVLAEITPEEEAICSLQLGFAERLRKSPYYLVEKNKSTELPRYIDKYKPSVANRATLKRSQLHAPFFPAEILEAYFNPKKKRKVVPSTDATSNRRRMNIDEMADEDEEEKSEREGSDNGSQAAEEDYDVDEDYGDNDYADNYFDNGEDDNMDDMAGGGDDGGGGGDWD